ncbi:hypothetical protein JYK04_08064 [Streptomyces nojiriensis]|nr:hypothetical protein JYK04_08064 [Streptomyces nojiriensis]
MRRHGPHEGQQGRRLVRNSPRFAAFSLPQPSGVRSRNRLRAARRIALGHPVTDHHPRGVGASRRLHDVRELERRPKGRYVTGRNSNGEQATLHAYGPATSRLPQAWRGACRRSRRASCPVGRIRPPRAGSDAVPPVARRLGWRNASGVGLRPIPAAQAAATTWSSAPGGLGAADVRTRPDRGDPLPVERVLGAHVQHLAVLVLPGRSRSARRAPRTGRQGEPGRPCTRRRAGCRAVFVLAGFRGLSGPARPARARRDRRVR